MDSDGERLRLVAETISEVFWIESGDRSRLDFISPAYEQVWGRSLEGAYRDPRSLRDAIHPDDRERVDRAEGGSLEYRIVRPDGSIRWISERRHPRRDATGTVESYVGVAQDITDRKALASERDAVVERFHLMSRAMNEGMWDWNIGTNTAWWSEVMYTAFGLSRSTTPSYENWSERLHPEDRDRVLAGFQRVIANGEQTWSDEYRFVRPDGVVLELLDRGFVMFDDRGKPVRMVGVVMDMTQQRALERQLRHAQKMEALGQLAGGIAHDFNNVLQAVTLELALLQAIPEMTANALGHIADIRGAFERATNLTRQLLVFSRREAMRPRRLELNAKVVELSRMLRRVLGEAITLEHELARGMLFAEIDPSMLDQVLVNLAVNARDAMPRGGTLTIATSLWERSEPPARTPGRYARITVRDTGVGIPREVLPRIFEPFFTTKGSSNTGLGLATAHGIIEQHRGWIEVDSELDRGTTFHVHFPALDGVAEVAVAVEPPRAQQPRGNETILVVEDDPAVRRAVCALLENHGYQVVEADCGSAALSTWDDRQGRIDLVVTDLVMPGSINGRDLVMQLVAQHPGVKIIVATGYGRDLDRGSLGRDFEVLHKPIDAGDLLDVVRTALDR